MTRYPLIAVLAAWLVSNAAAEELHLYNWGDYINPQILGRFTEESGIKVSLDVYGSNEEMLAKLQAGATGYDLVFPSVHMHDSMAALGIRLSCALNPTQKANIVYPMLGARWEFFTINRKFPNRYKVGQIFLLRPNWAKKSPCLMMYGKPWAWV